MSLYLTSKKKLSVEQATKAAFVQFFEKRITGENEWDEIKHLTKDGKATHISIAKARIDGAYKVSKMKFVDPIHVSFRAKQFSNLSDYVTAENIFKEAFLFYKKNIKKHIKNNMFMFAEIGFDTFYMNKNKAIPKHEYNVHAHVICERKDYELLKQNTSKWRIGSNSNEHYLGSRFTPRSQKDQSIENYVLKSYLYMSKWGIHQGDSRIATNKGLGKKKVTQKIDDLRKNYAELKSLGYFQFEAKKKGKKKYKNVAKELEKARKTYLKWQKLVDLEKHKTKVLNNRPKQLKKPQKSVSRPKRQVGKVTPPTNSS